MIGARRNRETNEPDLPVTMRCPSCGQATEPAARFCPSCGATLADVFASREVRKTVTVLFADISGSTELGERLDPEALRTLLSRHFSSARAILERHGGTVEKFIGDAVMAVFGIPVIHEDDALRAIRAALELQAGVNAINAESTVPATLAVRIGINTGEVVSGSNTGETLVTGDTVNTAARLEQAAQPGEILVGVDTHDLVRDAVRAEAMPALVLKGKSAPVPSFRVVSITGEEGHRRHAEAPIVGRAAELASLTDAWRATHHGRASQLITVLATAGVGKSRLIRELAIVLEPEATIGRGRCSAVRRWNHLLAGARTGAFASRD